MTNRELPDPGDPDADGRSDAQKYLDYGLELRAAVAAAIVPWLTSVLEGRSGDPLPEALVSAIDDVSQHALANITTLIEADVDRPLSGPLEQIRRAVVGLGPVLDEIGFVAPSRDPFDVQMSPADTHSLGPASFFELGEDVQRAGITWGAAKAHLHRSRRRDP